MKRKIRLTEAQLHEIIKETVEDTMTETTLDKISKCSTLLYQIIDRHIAFKSPHPSSTEQKFKKCIEQAAFLLDQAQQLI